MQKFILFLLSFLLAISIFFTGCKKAEQIFDKSGEKSDEPVIQESIGSDFFEDFDGTKLKNYWEVINPNTENFFMKNGELLVISSSDIKLSDKNVENVFRLKKSLPQGDWAMTARVNIEFQTEVERMFLGIYEEPENFIVVSPECSSRGSSTAFCYLIATKNSRGNKVEFRDKFWKSEIRGPFKESIKALPQPLIFRIRKEGHSYFAGVMMDGAKEKKWIELEKLTIIRPKGNPILGLYQEYGEYGKTPVTIDWVKIEKTE